MRALLLIGAAEYPIDDAGTELLLEWIRDLCPADDPHGAACLRLADAIEQADGAPIELGHSESEGLSAYVMRDFLVHGHAGLTALHFALLRLRGDPF